MRLKGLSNNQTLPMWAPPSDWKPPVLSELPSWKGQKYVSIDTEFNDPTLAELGLGARRGVKIAGYSFAFEDNRKFYVPVRHPEGNVDLEQAMAYVRDQAKDYDGELVGANLPTELDLLKYEPTGEIIFPKVKFMRDVQVIAALINELHFQYNLEVLCEREGIPGKTEDLLKLAAQEHGYDITRRDWKKSIPQMHSKYSGMYAEDDALRPIDLLKIYQKYIDADGLQQIVDVESKVLPIALKMRQRGVAIDFAHLEKVEQWARAQETLALDEIKHMTGVRIPEGMTMTTRLCLPAFEAIGLTVPKTYSQKTGKYTHSIDAEYLASIDHPLGKKLRRARKMGKLYGTFVESIRAYQTNGRIHPTFRQIVGSTDNNEQSGAAFGRFSCVDPNWQQQPSDPEYGDFWRAIYVPEPGAIWGCLDYAAQEPRWTTHHAARLNLKGAREAAKAYCDDPKIDPHGLMAKITGLPRKQAKIVFLALCYGEGGAKLCGQLGLPTRWCVRYRESGATEFYDTKAMATKARLKFDGEASFYEVAGVEGQKILDTFNTGAPFVKELAKMAERQAKKIGKINLLGGRVLHFPQADNGEFMNCYKALNRKVQGDAGMQMKLAIIAIDEQMPEVFLQGVVHDEADGSFDSIGQMKRCAKIMREAAGETYVPYRVDIEAGKNWGSLSLVCGECENFVDKTFEVWDNFVDSKGVEETYYCQSHARHHAPAGTIGFGRAA